MPAEIYQYTYPGWVKIYPVETKEDRKNKLYEEVAEIKCKLMELELKLKLAELGERLENL